MKMLVIGRRLRGYDRSRLACDETRVSWRGRLLGSGRTTSREM
jgi:hypothetical protein